MTVKVKRSDRQGRIVIPKKWRDRGEMKFC